MDQANWPYLGLRDPVSAGTHFFAFLLALAAAVLLWRRSRGDLGLRLSTACFSAGMILLYGTSATYHAVRLEPAKLRFFQLLDHSAIFVLIAGSFTPPIVLLLPTGWRRGIYLVGIWSFGLVGIATKWLLPAQPYGLEIGFYFGMGWVAVLILHDLVRCLGARGLAWAAGGGVLYTLGGLVDLLAWPVPYPRVFGPHEMFHVLTMGGTLCHFMFITHHVVPYGIARCAPDR